MIVRNIEDDKLQNPSSAVPNANRGDWYEKGSCGAGETTRASNNRENKSKRAKRCSS